MNPKVAVIGEIYSPNLGDGVIADSMTMLVARAGVDVIHVDLSGKSSWTDTFHPQSARISPALHRAMRLVIPQQLRGRLREREWLKNNHHNLANRVAEYSKGCDAAILGGGQLLHDNTLRFPMKIRSATAGLRESGISRIAILGCGVGYEWSTRAKQILNEALDPLEVLWVGVRDPASLQVINRVLPTYTDRSHWSTDVAIWCDEVYNQTPAELNADRTHVGIGIINPNDALGTFLADDDPKVLKLIDQWHKVVSGLVARGHRVTLFSNGDPNDHALAERIAQECKNAELNARPTRPAELVEQISQFGSIIAHRLHALIISYALRVPALPLVWDKKVQGFSKITDREDIYLARENQSASNILMNHERLLSKDFNDDTRIKLREQTASDIREAVQLLTAD